MGGSSISNGDIGAIPPSTSPSSEAGGGETGAGGSDVAAGGPISGVTDTVADMNMQNGRPNDDKERDGNGGGDEVMNEGEKTGSSGSKSTNTGGNVEDTNILGKPGKDESSSSNGDDGRNGLNAGNGDGVTPTGGQGGNEDGQNGKPGSGGKWNVKQDGVQDGGVQEGGVQEGGVQGGGGQTGEGQAGGGQASGGQASGGQASGGQASGGQASGGQASGGQASGGQASGGQASGGQASGGQASGGQASGGQASGGQASGGQASGGQGGEQTNGGQGGAMQESGGQEGGVQGNAGQGGDGEYDGGQGDGMQGRVQGGSDNTPNSGGNKGSSEGLTSVSSDKPGLNGNGGDGNTPPRGNKGNSDEREGTIDGQRTSGGATNSETTSDRTGQNNNGDGSYDIDINSKETNGGGSQKGIGKKPGGGGPGNGNQSPTNGASDQGEVMSGTSADRGKNAEKSYGKFKGIKGTEGEEGDNVVTDGNVQNNRNGKLGNSGNNEDTQTVNGQNGGMSETQTGVHGTQGVSGKLIVNRLKTAGDSLPSVSDENRAEDDRMNTKVKIDDKVTQTDAGKGADSEKIQGGNDAGVSDAGGSNAGTGTQDKSGENGGLDDTNAPGKNAGLTEKGKGDNSALANVLNNLGNNDQGNNKGKSNGLRNQEDGGNTNINAKGTSGDTNTENGSVNGNEGNTPQKVKTGTTVNGNKQPGNGGMTDNLQLIENKNSDEQGINTDTNGIDVSQSELNKNEKGDRGKNEEVNGDGMQEGGLGNDKPGMPQAETISTGENGPHGQNTATMQSEGTGNNADNGRDKGQGNNIETSKHKGNNQQGNMVSLLENKGSAMDEGKFNPVTGESAIEELHNQAGNDNSAGTEDNVHSSPANNIKQKLSSGCLGPVYICQANKQGGRNEAEKTPPSHTPCNENDNSGKACNSDTRTNLHKMKVFLNPLVSNIAGSGNNAPNTNMGKFGDNHIVNAATSHSTNNVNYIDDGYHTIRITNRETTANNNGDTTVSGTETLHDIRAGNIVSEDNGAAIPKETRNFETQVLENGLDNDIVSRGTLHTDRMSDIFPNIDTTGTVRTIQKAKHNGDNSAGVSKIQQSGEAIINDGETIPISAINLHSVQKANDGTVEICSPQSTSCIRKPKTILKEFDRVNRRTFSPTPDEKEIHSKFILYVTYYCVCLISPNKHPSNIRDYY